MSANQLKERSLVAYWELSHELLGFVQQKFPDCQNTKDLLLLQKNVILPDRSRRLAGVQKWCDSMREPLNPKRVKYARALERCLNEEGIGGGGIVAHAMQYKDMAAVQSSCSSDVISRLDLADKLKACTTDEASVVWKYLLQINRAAFEAVGAEEPVAPTRVDLAKHVKRKETAADAPATATVNGAFVAALNAFLHACGAEPVAEPEAVACKQRWADLVAGRGGGEEAAVSLPSLVAERNVRCVPLVQEALRCPSFPDAPSEEQWKLLEHVASIAAVDRAVPDRMMGQIEGYASKLAEDILAGKASLSSLDCGAMGDELMKTLDPSDIQALASNMDSLLPAIRKLQSGGASAQRRGGGGGGRA